MRRRDFISSIGGATAAWPLAARGQQPAKTYRIAVVHPSAPVADMSERGGNPNYAALFRELRRLGYTEGVNLIVARYSGEGREERFPEVCQEVVRTKPDVIVASSSRLALSFKAATLTVPIVAIMADPVPSGLVANIARPEGKHHRSKFRGRARDLGQAFADPARSCPDGIEGGVPRLAPGMEPAAAR
jgi:putative tryptophan/tyrosine transport system substrate-binding protein